MKSLTSRTVGIACLAILGIGSAADAQDEPPPAPVRYTPVRAQAAGVDVVLTGTVESRTVSLVAAEVAGAVVELDAREGKRVEKGSTLARLRTESLELLLRAHEGGLAEAQARLANAERQLGRARELLDANHISPEQFDTRLTERDAWQGRVRQLEAEIAGTRLDIERCHIRSPLSGVVVSERTEVGEWIGVGSPVVEVMSLDEMDVRVDVPERYYHRLSVGEGARVTIDALPGVEIRGQVSALIPRADARARTFPAKISIKNPGGLGAGMLANVHLGATGGASATLVPKDAVVAQRGQSFVYVIGDDDTVSQVPVRVGRGVGAWTVVEGELMAEQRVVTRGNERLRPGQRVSGEPIDYELP